MSRAKEITGIDKVYALVGGFHLAPAPLDYLAKVMAELKVLDIEHVFPMSKADIADRGSDVRFEPKADVAARP